MADTLMSCIVPLYDTERGIGHGRYSPKCYMSLEGRLLRDLFNLASTLSQALKEDSCIQEASKSQDLEYD